MRSGVGGVHVFPASRGRAAAQSRGREGSLVRRSGVRGRRLLTDGAGGRLALAVISSREIGHARKFEADRPDDTPAKVISIKLALPVASAELVSLT